MIHLTLQQISSYLDSELPEASMELVRLHLSSCPACTEQFAKMEAQEEALARVLTNDPDSAFLDDLLEAVSTGGKRTARRSKKRATAEPSPREGARDRKDPERRAPDRRGAEPGEAGAEAPGDGSSETRGTRRRESDAPEPVAEPVRSASRGGIWIAISLVAIAASVALVIGGRLVPRLASPPPPRTSAAPPVSRDTPAAPPADRHGDELAILEGAARASSDAERAGTAAAYDGAAAAWVRALPTLRGDVAEEAAGRQELMEARYRAWTLAPTASRRGAAIEAVRSYLVIAPSDGQRDSAWAWLAQLKR